MGRALKGHRPDHRAGGQIYRPAAHGWERWSQDENDAWHREAEAAELAGLAPVAGGLIAVPVRRAFSLSVWLPSDDPSIYADLIYTQLELRGLAGRTREASSFAFEVVEEGRGQVLVHAVVLPVHLAPQYWHGEVTQYAVSPACLPLTPAGVTIWREEGGWVAAVTRGGRLMHFQTLTEPEPDGAMALELWMMLAMLEAGGMVNGAPDGVLMLHPEGSAPDLDAWRASGGLSVRLLAWPPPVRPEAALSCVPVPVRDLQQTKAVAAKRQQIALLAATAYFVLILGLAAYTGWLFWQAKSLRAELARDADTVAEVRQTMQTWGELSAALDPQGYPLEVLYQVSSALPKDGVRLTLFQMSLDRVVITGEASTLQAAQRFQEEVSKNPALSGFRWTADNPKPLPNGSTRFQIDGLNETAAGKKQPEGENTDT